MRKQQQQIEEMANCSPCYERYGKCPIKDKTNCNRWTRAVNQYEQGYRKIPEDAVVLTKVEYESLRQSLTQTTNRECELADRARALLHECDVLKIDLEKARKKTAKEILDYFDRYAGTGEKLIGNMISEQRKKYGIEVNE